MGDTEDKFKNIQWKVTLNKKSFQIPLIQFIGMYLRKIFQRLIDKCHFKLRADHINPNSENNCQKKRTHYTLAQLFKEAQP